MRLPKLDVCKNFDNTKIKPVLPDDAPIAVVLFAGGGGIEAGMVQAGIRPVIAVEFDPTKPDLSRAIAKIHHRNFHEYGCKVIQLTVQEIAQLEFIGFPRYPDYLHASPVCANFSKGEGTVKSLSIKGAAILQGFPSWYEFPNETATAGSIIGYSVPPSFAAQLFTHIQKQLSGAFL
ncbi:DNA cytosine methyltransferase [Nostoc sp. FACHB-133]|uniref:DNA cytosine methyltransferase n=1 Tax=Nostoc sp. FACHB-133 TaxID=2692835 RepID=UPI0028C502D4|nr:DNA cytosine methyltransferase [Nostoc sp. FACHB-133]